VTRYHQPPVTYAVPGTIIDPLANLLRSGRAPSLDYILREIAPPEPLGPPEGGVMVQRPGMGWVEGKHQRWPNSVIMRSERFPGYQPGYRFRESRKYISPRPDAPLSKWVKSFVDTARSHWSVDIGADRGATRLQFKDWLPQYLNDNDWFWRFGERWGEAAQILRLACGLPQFPPGPKGVR